MEALTQPTLPELKARYQARCWGGGGGGAGGHKAGKGAGKETLPFPARQTLP